MTQKPGWVVGVKAASGSFHTHTLLNSERHIRGRETFNKGTNQIMYNVLTNNRWTKCHCKPEDPGDRERWTSGVNQYSKARRTRTCPQDTITPASSCCSTPGSGATQTQKHLPRSQTAEQALSAICPAVVRRQKNVPRVSSSRFPFQFGTTWLEYKSSC